MRIRVRMQVAQELQPGFKIIPCLSLHKLRTEEIKEIFAYYKGLLGPAIPLLEWDIRRKL